MNQIKEEVVRHFNNIYTKQQWERSLLDEVQFKSIDKEARKLMVERFSYEEVEETVNIFDGNKCPRLDGYNFKFIQSFWDLLKEDVRGRLMNSLNMENCHRDLLYTL